MKSSKRCWKGLRKSTRNMPSCSDFIIPAPNSSNGMAAGRTKLISRTARRLTPGGFSFKEAGAVKSASVPKSPGDRVSPRHRPIVEKHLVQGHQGLLPNFAYFVGYSLFISAI